MSIKRKSKVKINAHKEVDWSAESVFDKNRSIIYIEHTNECPIFQTKAEELLAYLTETIPDRMFVLIRNKDPRPGAFEINFSQNAQTSVHNLWSGLDKGPPRRDKFPKNYDLLLPEIRKILKKFYPYKVQSESILKEDYNDQPTTEPPA